MAKTKKDAVKAENAKTEKIVESAVKTEVKAEPKKKTAETKTETKVEVKNEVKTAETKTETTKKAPAKRTTSKKTVENVYIQHNGSEYLVTELIEKAKVLSEVKSPKKIDLYVKPDDNAAYYVVDDKSGKIDL